MNALALKTVENDAVISVANKIIYKFQNFLKTGNTGIILDTFSPLCKLPNSNLTK